MPVVAEPAVLAAQKVLAILARSGRPKSFLDRRDLAVLLLAFPDLRHADGASHRAARVEGPYASCPRALEGSGRRTDLARRTIARAFGW